MKKIILLVVLSVTVNVFAQNPNVKKKQIYDDGEVIVNLFTHNMKRDNSKIMFWDEWQYIDENARVDFLSDFLKYEYRKDKIELWKKFGYIKTCYVVDCNTGMYQIWAIIYLTKNYELIDTTENRTDESLKWTIPMPDSIMEFIMNTVCKDAGF